MTPAEVAAKLRQFNEWRRGDYEPSEQPEPPNPYEVGLAIDAAVEMIERLEEAEKENALKERVIDALGSELNAVANERDALRARIEVTDEVVRELEKKLSTGMWRALREENEALRAKIEQMEQQEPVAWLHETRRDSDVVTDAVKHVWGKTAVGSMAAYSIPLYALPGAAPEAKP